MSNFNWQPLLVGAGTVIKEVASAFGPIPAAIADFSVDALTAAISGVVAGDDAVKLTEALEDQVGALLEKLKTGQ